MCVSVSLRPGVRVTIGAGVAVCLFFVFSRNVNLITAAAVSLLDNFPISGLSTLHNPVQSLVGLQGTALRDQFYPNRVDAGMHLKWLMGFQRSPLGPSVLVLRALLTTLMSLQTALTKENVPASLQSSLSFSYSVSPLPRLQQPFHQGPFP